MSATWRESAIARYKVIGSTCLGLFDTCPCDTTVRRIALT